MDKLKFKNLKKHQHNFNKGKVGSELKCNKPSYRNFKNHGFDEICEELKYENLKLLMKIITMIFKKISFSISKDKPINRLTTKT